MSEEQKKQLAALKAKAELNATESEELNILLAAEISSSSSMDITGHTTIFEPTVFDTLLTSNPLVNLVFTAGPAEPLFTNKMEFEYLVPTGTTNDWTVGEMEEGGEIDVREYKTQLGRGKLRKFKEWSGDFLYIAYQQAKLRGAKFISDGGLSTPIAKAKKVLDADLVKFLGTKLYSGEILPNKDGLGIVGMKKQHALVNVDQTSNINRFDTTTYADDTNGRRAYIYKLMHAQQSLKQYGFGDFVLLMPNSIGSLGKFLSAWYDVNNVNPLVQIVETLQQQMAAGQGNAPISDANNQVKLPGSNITIISLDDGMTTGEAFFYPTKLNGESTIKRYEFVDMNGQTRGVQTRLGVSDDVVLSYFGLDRNAIKEYLMNESRVNIARLYRTWDGGFLFGAVGVSTLFTGVGMFTAAVTTESFSDVTAKNKVIDLTVVS